MPSYRASIPLSNHTLIRLAELIRTRHAERCSRWRKLDPAQQAPLVLAHLRNGDTYARLAAGFAVGTTTAWHYVREVVDLLAALADDVHAAVARAARLAYTILDGTLIPIDRLADERPYYSGKHKRHGMNVQLLADPMGRLVWASPALPGAVHDVTAARKVGLIDALTSAGVKTFADKGYQGAGGAIRTPFKRHRHRPGLSRGQRDVNRAHARIRAIGESAVATLKGWNVLTRLRCCPHRATALVQAILVLQLVEEGRYAG
ncbi:transposase family protein [Nonomuraea jiangxiensis]|uniref:Helix-turn-helix of DDE superfamily endonuclease n=1 Tax=Nonomuraea jiangxiensis TaxID=633440 RepID=A0A1G9W6G5_9ACTN|nr:transposase family protein [Nonomuraea jiangxiensis]SDM79913.1 Helix-turn-helix of DDE superfamily endonuclease [Nonomuraea jiangxiensis]